ncbi:MAG: peptide transporter [Armatimonadetes bacterium]|nr:peptide transporter [Armatimonadota bacterium]
MAHDPELELYRGLMDTPESYEDGFDVKTIIGALFIGFVMMPGAIYLGLVVGRSLGPAAEWTTIILFTEIARRSFITLKRQEVYILFYIAAALASSSGSLQLAGGAFAGKMWDQYFVRSPAARGLGIAHQIPAWVVPGPDSEAILKRTFFHPDWYYPTAILLIGVILSRMNWFGLGYVLFRITSDYERLPFPFAAITAQGATALAETTTKTETWRWRVFSIGAMVGLVFGAFYVGVPTITGVIMTKPLQLLPIPWVELTRNTEHALPAVATGFVTDLGTIIAGFVVPFWAVVGSFVAAVSTFFLNPWLYRMGVLEAWKPGMDTIQTRFANTVDFYFSTNIGISFAVAVIGIAGIIAHMHRNRKAQETGREQEPGTLAEVPGRGDVPLSLAIGLFLVSTLGYVILCRHLVPNFPLFWVIFFGFFFTPLNSYIDARMKGLTGQWVQIPMVKQGVIILSGYKGIDIWFAPIPEFDHGARAQQFRVLELTGNKVISLVKAELLILPIVVFCSLLYWQFIWRLAPVPSVNYPYAQKMWHLSALQRGLWLTATLTGRSLFHYAFKWKLVVGGFVFGIASYSALALLRLPVLLIYGVVRGLGQLPHYVFPEMVGALISQFYLGPRFGMRRWKQYATVLSAGYACGMGLVGMGAVAFALIGQAVSQMPY